MEENVDRSVVAGFGDEWSRFDQSKLSDAELLASFNEYFNIFPWNNLPENSVGFDLGCGSGRWAKLVAPRVGALHLIDPSPDALAVAKRNLNNRANCYFHVASVDSIPIEDSTCDFGYSLGVLHHIPDTEAGLKSCVAKLRPGAPFLLYLYYKFDNRPAWFRAIWSVSEIGRRVVSKLPHPLRFGASQFLAASIYYPLARASRFLEKFNVKVDSIPLSQYRNKSFYSMRTDALDRFGTRLEKRFTRTEIQEMMEKAGLEKISFSKTAFWTAVGTKRPEIDE